MSGVRHLVKRFGPDALLIAGIFLVTVALWPRSGGWPSFPFWAKVLAGAVGVMMAGHAVVFLWRREWAKAKERASR